MNRNCPICLLRPLFVFNSVTNVFANFNCSHSSRPSQKAFIKNSKRKRYTGTVLQALAVILGFVELYLTFGTCDIKDILNGPIAWRFLATYFFLRGAILNNFNWDEKLKDLQGMLYIFGNVERFATMNRYFKFYFAINYGGICMAIFTFVTHIYYVLSENMEIMVLLKIVNRILVGFTVSSFYSQMWIEFFMYYVLFHKTFDQIANEISLRLSTLEGIVSISSHIHVLPARPIEGNFLRKLKKLRKMYMAIMESFVRATISVSGSIKFSSVLTYITLIWLLFVAILGIKGDIDFRLRHYALFTTYLVEFLASVLFGILCDKIHCSANKVKTTMFKIPLKKLKEEESKEVELFIKLLGWEQPLKDENSNGTFGTFHLAKMLVNVVVNCMVIIQLYLYFTKVDTTRK